MAFSVKTLAKSTDQGSLVNCRIQSKPINRLKEAIEKVKNKALNEARKKLVASAFESGLATTVMKNMQDLEGDAFKTTCFMQVTRVLQRLSSQERAQYGAPGGKEDFPLATVPSSMPTEKGIEISEEEKKLIEKVRTFMDNLLTQSVDKKKKSRMNKIYRVASVVTGIDQLLEKAEVVQNTAKRSRNTKTPNSLPQLSSKTFDSRKSPKQISRPSSVTSVGSSPSYLSGRVSTPISSREKDRLESTINRLSPRLSNFSLESNNSRSSRSSSRLPVSPLIRQHSHLNGPVTPPLMGSFNFRSIKSPVFDQRNIAEAWESIETIEGSRSGKVCIDSDNDPFFAPTPHNTPEKPKVRPSRQEAKIASFLKGDKDPNSIRFSPPSPGKPRKRKHKC